MLKELNEGDYITALVSYDLNEGDYITALVGYDREYYLVDGIIFNSIGLLISEDGSYTQLYDVSDYSKRTRRQATDAEIKSVLDNYEFEYICNDSKKIAKEYIKNHSENEILPIKYGYFKTKEELLNVIYCCDD